MNWSWSIGRIRGIRLEMHMTFLILIAVAALSGIFQSGSLEVGFTEALFVAALFGFVVLHELGHALMAEVFGVSTDSILLLPIGGVARMNGMPRRPAGEVAIALAGPLVNMVCATVLLPLSAGVSLLSLGCGAFLSQLLWANVALALFNLLPAFPMDGGRVLRALLSPHWGRRQATETAARVSRGVAVAMGFIGLFGNPMLLMIAIFVWFEAQRELDAAQFGYGSEFKGLETQFVSRDPMESIRNWFGSDDDRPVHRGPWERDTPGRDVWSSGPERGPQRRTRMTWRYWN